MSALIAAAILATAFLITVELVYGFAKAINILFFTEDE